MLFLMFAVGALQISLDNIYLMKFRIAISNSLSIKINQCSYSSYCKLQFYMKLFYSESYVVTKSLAEQKDMCSVLYIAPEINWNCLSYKKNMFELH